MAAHGAGPEARDSARLRLGTCPDSWGVWFADDPRQTPWTRFLDEVAEVGYPWLELGPYGYLPTDRARLSDELARRGLSRGRRHRRTGTAGCTGPATGRTSPGSPARCPSSPPPSAGGT